MKNPLPLLALLLATGCTALTEKTLFNGIDLAGWDAPPGWWRVEDGALTSESTPQKPCTQCNYLIWKETPPQDFQLTADFRLSNDANSGIQIRSQTRPNYDTWGFQADMSGNGELVGFIYHHERGLIVERGQKVTISPDGKRHIQSLADPSQLLNHFKPLDWNSYRIVCRGHTITLYLNNVLMSQVTVLDPKLAASNGIIALQMHPGPPMKVQFKNIRLKKLS